MSGERFARVTWGPNVLDFPTAEDACDFARELGAEAVSYRPYWWTEATS